MSINDILAQIGIQGGLQGLQNYGQQFSGDINMQRYGKHLPQFPGQLLQQAFSAGMEEYKKSGSFTAALREGTAGALSLLSDILPYLLFLYF